MFSATKGGSPSGYQISRSVRLRSSASAYLNRTPASTTNRKTWTWSAWAKRGSLGAARNLITAIGSSRATYITFTSADKLTIYSATSAGGGDGGEYVSTQVFRDPSAWYHIVVAYDSTQATSTNRIKAFINGIQITSWATSGAPTLNHDTQFNWTGAPMQLGAYNASQFFDGYLTEVNFIDGQALDASYFGETNPVTGVWQPKKCTGTYGTNGFYLNFSDNSAATAAAIGKDYSGNGNNWTPNNISVTAGVTYDSMLDVPTQWADGGNGRGNYAVMNPLHMSGTATPTNGNLTVSQANNQSQVASSIGMASGKWYYEHTITAVGGEQSVGIGTAVTTGIVGTTSFQWGYYSVNGNKYTNGGSSAYGASYTTGDVIGVAYDADAGSLTFYKNGASQGVAYAGLSGTMFALAATRSTGGTNISDLNFGQRPFSYTPPTGFKALNTLNLPTPTILKGNQYFDATTYTGNGSSQTLANSGAMQPDLVWVKSRSAAATNHQLVDSVRGNTKYLSSDLTAAEVTNANSISITSTGFSVGALGDLNTNTATYVGWQWKEGATQGFDIVTYTGDATTNRAVAHNLGVTPSMFIIKARSAGTTSWIVHHKDMGNNGGSPSYLQYCLLESAAAKAASTSLLPTSNLSSTTFPTSGATNNTNVNGSGTTYVAYLFSEVAGFSKFGSYTGNGSADGPFVFCGFRPRFIMFKRTDTTSNWLMIDTARSAYNQTNEVLLPNSSAAEGTGAGYGAYDFLSNGFKPRNVVANETNVNGGTYIYAAFAESPFKNALAR